MFPIRDSVPSRHPPLATWALIGFNVFVFVLEARMPEARLERVFHVLGLVPAYVTGQAGPAGWVRVGPLLTSMFLHAGWLHIFGNMWTLWIFGDNVEDRMGPVRFLVFYLLCGVAAGAVHVWVHPGSTVPTVGASGAIAGVMGAYFVMFPRARIVLLFPVFFLPVFFSVPAVLYIGLWMYSQVLSGVLTLGAPEAAAGVAWWAHIGGFAAGLLTFSLFLRPRTLRRRFQPDEIGWEGAWTGRGGRGRW